MITAVPGPLIVQPEYWTLVFNRKSATRWAGWLALGRYKHVRAYAYVPFLHVWVFYDVRLGGTDIIVAADGEPANALISSWIQDADLVRMRRRPPSRRVPVLGFCVPAIKRLLGIPCGALRVDALRAWCLANGGEPFEGANGRAEVPASVTRPVIPAPATAEPAAGR